MSESQWPGPRHPTENTNVGTMLVQRRRRWSKIAPALHHHNRDGVVRDRRRRDAHREERDRRDRLSVPLYNGRHLALTQWRWIRRPRLADSLIIPGSCCNSSRQNTPIDTFLWRGLRVAATPQIIRAPACQLPSHESLRSHGKTRDSEQSQPMSGQCWPDIGSMSGAPSLQSLGIRNPAHPKRHLVVNPNTL